VSRGQTGRSGKKNLKNSLAARDLEGHASRGHGVLHTCGPPPGWVKNIAGGAVLLLAAANSRNGIGYNPRLTRGGRGLRHVQAYKEEKKVGKKITQPYSLGIGGQGGPFRRGRGTISSNLGEKKCFPLRAHEGVVGQRGGKKVGTESDSGM